MLESIFLVVALVGSGIAGLWDLKTTEIPDEIPYTMMAIGFVGHAIQSYLTWSPWPIFSCLIAGLGFLGFGFLMYYLGQWGGGDAKLLSGMGFLLPISSRLGENLLFPFSLSFFFNVFFVGSVYMLVYSIIMAFVNRKIIFSFIDDLKGNTYILVFLVAFSFMTLFLLARYVEFVSLRFVVFGSLWLVGSFLVWRFVKTVETVGFRKRIHVSKLREGDVLAEYKMWEGVTKEELEKIKKSKKKYVVIKEGVRFGPVFLFSLVFTILVGDGIIWLIRLVQV